MSSLQQGFSSQILREFTARDLNEIIFVEKQSMTGSGPASKIFQNQKRFSIEETTVTSRGQATAPEASAPEIPLLLAHKQSSVSQTIAEDQLAL